MMKAVVAILLVPFLFVRTDAKKSGEKEKLNCSPCQMNNLAADSKNFKPVPGPALEGVIQGGYGTKCYYPFEGDDKSLAVQVALIEKVLAAALISGAEEGTYINSNFAKYREAKGGWREFLSSSLPEPTKTEGNLPAPLTEYPEEFRGRTGCYFFFYYVHDEAYRDAVDPGREHLEWWKYEERYDAPERRLWHEIRDYVKTTGKLPMTAVYSLEAETLPTKKTKALTNLQKHRLPYRDDFSFCRYVLYTRPGSLYQRCAQQLPCGLVRFRPLNALVDNIVQYLLTVLQGLDKTDTAIRKQFMEDDEATFEALDKELRSLISLNDLTFLLDPSVIARDVPCLHLNFEFRAVAKKNWDLVVKKMGAQKGITNGLKRHLREAFILHIRRRQPALMKKTQDGTKFQLRQVDEDCSCSAPFYKILKHIEQIVQVTNFEDNGFDYVFPEIDINSMTEREFFQAFMAACDFGINLECNSKCKCVCPKGADCTSAAPRLDHLPLVQITSLVVLLLVFKCSRGQI